MSDPSKVVDEELKKYSAAIERLSVFFAEGRINEQSYLISVRKLEERIKRLEETKESPDIEQTSVENLRQSREPSFVEESPTALWYLIPFFFGLIGGFVAYIGVKDRDESMATNLLVFGIVWSLIMSLIAWVWWSAWLSSIYRCVNVLSAITR